MNIVETKQHIQSLIEDAATTADAERALQLSQAALNAAKALDILIENQYVTN